MRIYRDVKAVLLAPTTASTPGGSEAGGDQPPPQGQVQSVHVAQGYVERIIKLIPGEVIVTYPIISGLTRQIPDHHLGGSIAGLAAVGMTIFLRTVGLVAATRPQLSALLISTIAAVIWVYQQKGFVFFEIPTGYENLVTVVLIIFIVCTAPLVKGDVRETD